MVLTATKEGVVIPSDRGVRSGGIIKDAINSFFLEDTPSNFRWLETLRRECNRRENHNDYSPAYWKLSNPKKEVFKKLEVVSV